MTIRNRGLRTDRHQDSKEDRTRWEPVLTDKADPEPGETLRFIEKGFDVTPSPVAGPQPYGGNKRSRTMMHARGVKLHKKSQERWGPDAR